MTDTGGALPLIRGQLLSYLQLQGNIKSQAAMLKHLRYVWFVDINFDDDWRGQI